MHVLVGEPLCPVNVFRGKKTIARMIVPKKQTEAFRKTLSGAECLCG